MEAPALLGFLPQLCRRLLNEELQIPSVATWWCGRPTELAYVLQNLDQLAIKPAFGGVTAQATLPNRLAGAEREKLIAKIKARPRDFVGQQWVNRSTAPVLSNGGVQPWHVALRTFLVATKNSYEVMPGGLMRASAFGDRLGDSMLAGEGSKDVWVLSEGPVEKGQPIAPRGNSGSLAAKWQRLAQPRGRQLVLARPRRGTGGRRDPAAAERHPAAHQRNRTE